MRRRRIKTIISLLLIMSLLSPIFTDGRPTEASFQMPTMPGNNSATYDHVMDGMFAAIKNLPAINQLNQDNHTNDQINRFNALYNQIKHFLPFGTPKYITVNGSVQPLNIELWLDLNIVVFGDYKGINPREIDFKSDTRHPQGIKYYTKNGVMGEYRHHGYTVDGNLYANNNSPRDSDTGSLARDKRWIYHFWNHLHDDRISDYNESAIGGNTIIQQWLNKSLDWDIANGRNFNDTVNSNRQVMNYMNVQTSPTARFPGEGKMRHRNAGTVWYQVFTIPAIGYKNPTPIESEIAIPNPDHYVLATNMTSITIPVTVQGTLLDDDIYGDEVKMATYYHRQDIDTWNFNLNGQTEGQFNPFNANKANGAKQVFDMTFTRNELEAIAVNGVATVDLNSTTQATFYTTDPSEDPRSNTAIANTSVNIRIEPGGFKSGFLINNHIRIQSDQSILPSHVMYQDTSAGEITRFEYEIVRIDNDARDFFSFVTNKVDDSQVNQRLYEFIAGYESVIKSKGSLTFQVTQTISDHLGNTDSTSQTVRVTVQPDPPPKFAVPDVHIPDRAFDIVPFKPTDNTDLTDVKTKEVIVGGVSVNYEHFFSGNYVFGEIQSDNNTELKLVEVYFTSEDDIRTQYQKWVYVYNTKPKVQLGISGTTKENRKITISNNSAQANEDYLLQHYPITYTWSYDTIEGSSNDRRILPSGDSHKDLLYKAPGVYRVSIVGSNALGRVSERYDLDFVVFEDLVPAVELHLWNSTLSRNEAFEIHHVVTSTEGDIITSNTLEIWYDSKNDESFDTLLETMDASDFESYTPSKLGRYKLVNIVEEDFGQETIPQFITAADRRSVTIEREFFVDNLIPMTQLYVDIPADFPQVDIFMMNDAHLNRDTNDLIRNNRLDYMNACRAAGVSAQVNVWDMHTYVHDTPVNKSINTGSSSPSSTYFYNENGYSGDIPLVDSQNNWYWDDRGYWENRESCVSEPIREFVWNGHLCGWDIDDGIMIGRTCWVIVGYEDVCTTERYWVSNNVRVNNWTGYYSGTAYKNVRQNYSDPFRTISDKYVIYISEGNISELDDLQKIVRNHDVKLIVIGKAAARNQIQSHAFYLQDRPVDEIIEQVLRDITDQYSNYQGYTLLVDQPFSFMSENIDAEGDPIVEEGYQYVQDVHYFDHSMGLESFATAQYNENKWTSFKPTSFSKVGKYTLLHRVKDEPIDFEDYAKYSNTPSVDIVVHRKPIANATLDWDYDPSIGLYHTTWVDLSYDLDHEFRREDKGIVDRTIRYRRNNGEWYYQIPDQLPAGHYHLDYVVKDVEGVWSDPFTMSFTLSSTAPAQIVDAKLRTQLHTFSLNSVPASEQLRVYDIHTRYPYQHYLDLSMSSYSQRVNYYTGTKHGNDIQWDDVVMTIPATTPDGNYVFTMKAVPQQGGGAQATKTWNVRVNTPINLKATKPAAHTSLIVGQPYALEATTSKYATQVTATMFYGTPYATTKTLSAANISSGKRWSRNDTIPSIPDGNYQIRFVATTPSGKTEAITVPIEVINNRPPTAAFTWTPKPVWEGDVVTLHNQSTDPDGDSLTYTWRITMPDGTVVTSSAQHVTRTFSQIGTYAVELTVSDGRLTDTIRQHIVANELQLIPEVHHTPLWLEHHISAGHETDAPPKDFYSGEIFVLKATGSAAPIDRVTATLQTSGLANNAIFIEVDLVEMHSGSDIFTGELFDDILSSFAEGLQKGVEYIHFRMDYHNGVTKEASVPVSIIGNVQETIGVKRTI